MNLRIYFFLLFLILSTIFLLSSYNPQLIPYFFPQEENPKFIQMTIMVASALSLIIFMISNHIELKQIQLKKEKYEAERENIEKIHAELEALSK